MPEVSAPPPLRGNHPRDIHRRIHRSRQEGGSPKGVSTLEQRQPARTLRAVQGHRLPVAADTNPDPSANVVFHVVERSGVAVPPGTAHFTGLVDIDRLRGASRRHPVAIRGKPTVDDTATHFLALPFGRVDIAAAAPEPGKAVGVRRARMSANDPKCQHGCTRERPDAYWRKTGVERFARLKETHGNDCSVERRHYKPTQ